MFSFGFSTTSLSRFYCEIYCFTVNGMGVLMEQLNVDLFLGHRIGDYYEFVQIMEN